jgi:deoxyribonuclease V
VEKTEKQQMLSEMVVLEDRFDKIKKACGTASTYFEKEVISGAVLLQYNQVIETSNSVKEVVFPYKPGFLSFTEGPSTVEAIKKLHSKPDLVFVQGHGIAHPRRAGLACYVGVSTGIPCVGVAKEPLVGEYVVPRRPGQAVPITLSGKKVGWAFKPGADFSPIFVSPGNKVSVDSSLELVKEFLKKEKMPVPLVKAREYVKQVRKKVEWDLEKQENKKFV